MLRIACILETIKYTIIVQTILLSIENSVILFKKKTK
jgi:hypothetical protein